MNRSLLYTLAVIAIISISAQANSRSSLKVGDFVLSVDTVYHAEVGPGTTLTKLHFSGEHPLDAVYFTIDLKHPNVSINASQGSESDGLEKTSAMAKRLSKPGKLYFAGTNGTFFDVTKTYPDGSERPRLPERTNIIDGIITRTSILPIQFIVDKSGIPHIDQLDFSKGTLSHNGNSVSFGGVNIENINGWSGESATDNAVTIYTTLGWKSPFQTQYAGNCAEVQAKLVDGCEFAVAKKYKLEITSDCSSTGNMAIPSNGFVLLGRGAGKTFIEGLKVGDVVEVNNIVSMSNGSSIEPWVAVGGSPRTVVDGLAVESDGFRPDGVEFHPRTGVGYNKDKDKIIMMTVDGRGESLGATTRMLGDIMVHAGVYEGVNFDGGGSTTCYSSALGVVNTCSDASGERRVFGSIYATASGDTESTLINKIGFADWKKELLQGQTYTPTIYTYNAAGVLINTDFQNYTLECSPELGEISADGKSLIASGKSGVLKVKYLNFESSIAVDIQPVKHTSLYNTSSDWTVSATASKVNSITDEQNGMKVVYTMGPTTTTSKITFTNSQKLDAEAYGISIKYNSESTPKDLRVVLLPANETNGTTLTESSLKGNAGEWYIDFSKNFDTTNPATFPIEFVSFSISPSEAARASGSVTFERVAAVYPANGSGVKEVYAEPTDADITEEWFSITGTKVNGDNVVPGIYIIRRGNLSKKVIVR